MKSVRNVTSANYLSNKVTPWLQEVQTPEKQDEQFSHISSPRVTHEYTVQLEKNTSILEPTPYSNFRLFQCGSYGTWYNSNRYLVKLSI